MFSGTNVHETRTGNIKYSQHAEMSALREFIKFTYGRQCNFTTNSKPFRGKAPVIYVVRVMAVGYNNYNNNKNNICGGDGCWFGNSLPCKDCQKNLKKYGIRVIKYTTIIDNNMVLCELKLN